MQKGNEGGRGRAVGAGGGYVEDVFRIARETTHPLRLNSELTLSKTRGAHRRQQ